VPSSAVGETYGVEGSVPAIEVSTYDLASQRHGNYSKLTRTGQVQSTTPSSATGETYVTSGSISAITVKTIDYPSYSAVRHIVLVGGGGEPVQHHYYRMRAWNLTLVGWEIWTSVDVPDPNPPSGNPVTNVTLIGIWVA